MSHPLLSRFPSARRCRSLIQHQCRVKDKLVNKSQSGSSSCVSLSPNSSSSNTNIINSNVITRSVHSSSRSSSSTNLPRSSFIIGSMLVGGGLLTNVYRKSSSRLQLGISLLESSKSLKRAMCAQASEVMSVKDQDLPGWTKEATNIYRQHAEELLNSGWKILVTSVGRERDQALYSLSHPDVGAVFEYVVFYNPEEQKSRTIWQFGPKAQGPPGCVHGGAIATAGDACLGILVFSGLSKPCVTANLNINYKKPLPLGSTVVIESQVDKVEGRKYFTSCTVKSPDGSITYNTITALFVDVSHRIK